MCTHTHILTHWWLKWLLLYCKILLDLFQLDILYCLSRAVCVYAVLPHTEVVPKSTTEHSLHIPNAPPMFLGNVAETSVTQRRRASTCMCSCVIMHVCIYFRACTSLCSRLTPTHRLQKIPWLRSSKANVCVCVCVCAPLGMLYCEVFALLSTLTHTLPMHTSVLHKHIWLPKLISPSNSQVYFSAEHLFLNMVMLRHISALCVFQDALHIACSPIWLCVRLWRLLLSGI